MTARAPAADWYTGVQGDASAKPAAPTVAIDMALDATTQNALAGALIGTIAPFAPLEESGMRLRVSGILGKYDYIASEAGLGRINGTLEQGSFMVGYEYVTKQATVAGYIGGEVSHTGITPNDPNNTVKGTYAGLKVGADLYIRPTEATMIAGVVAYSTVNNAYYGRLKFGLAVVNQIYVGPEILVLGDNFFHQWRVGAHVSGIKLGMVQLGVSGGFLSDQVRGTGGYGILETRFSF
ncbi:MAG: cellulose biosynthesis protein BcsS [Methylocystis sp.]